jgi:hypothetical protein
VCSKLYSITSSARASRDGGTHLADDAVQFGSSLVIWGAAVRTVLVWHITWSVNSVTDLWGYRNYQTPDNSRNNVLVGLLAGGEGWHNNRHAAPASARHGHHCMNMRIESQAKSNSHPGQERDKVDKNNRRGVSPFD